MARSETVASGPGSRALIVDIIRSAGPVSRVELVQATGLTQPTISNIVRQLLASGVIRESGRTPSTGGKPRTLLEINPTALYAVGVQLGFEAMTFVAAGVGGGTVARQLVDGAALDDPQQVVERLAMQFRVFVDTAGIPIDSVAGVAVVVPGPLSPPLGTMFRSPTLRQWEGFPLAATLGELLPVPVVLDNDAAAAAIGEFWTRRVPRTDTFATVYMGTGIGAGVVIDGALYRGASSNAAELGHLSIDAEGVACSCGNTGCVERYAAPAAVLAEAVATRCDFLGLDLEFTAESTGQDFDRLARAAVGGHEAADALLGRSADRLAAAVVSFSNAFDLDSVVLAGPSFAIAGSLYAKAVRTRMERASFARRAHGVRIEIASNPRDSAAIGAAALVLQSSVAPGHGPVLSA
ncbi:ROK family transcriptional regulator [Curtobacterium caseinilyticum]|uniref:ROK family transcriptional regulator n=1 Tax=Curtobacterium caseinilyticum TaxID=3055137 RepID=A0ABT7TTF5_9MICO|nr:ROK family transcriptional regulator [Curtobacterium caseinilyticum]MDM7892800.1 ROK family transcriptional regulator [Curtobacterium caseinilyticum]